MSKCSKNQHSARIGAVLHSPSTYWFLSLPLGIPMAQTLKELAAKTEDLSSILGTHMVEEQDQPTSSGLHIYVMACVACANDPAPPHPNINFTSLIWL